ncbi:hypothetical protein CYLTODRAFT_421859 [Cylindrobasidium torrendii FP15055 ss-10]|uniref:DUF833-domain-containing protein n=1 Tax=Cylindrobasidium torrendii FP15055 ss-10 TaxID=1314674 RepID=A0A0D7BDH1_9AGAR|nr:hypothetical protein CYLTODRAFT_421859 [Cylindrobasidium torrendii FP15055 ss-10]
MCIVFWTLDHDDYALIMCTNRDEFLHRPTLNAHFHSFDHPTDAPEMLGSQNDDEGSVLSGIDLKGGGTWLGINRAGRIAVLTNITEAYTTYDTSRGSLCSSFLLDPPPEAQTLANEFTSLVAPDTKFAGFNLLLLSPVSAPSSQTTEYGAAHSLTVSYEALFATNNGGGGDIVSRTITKEDISAIPNAEGVCDCFSNGADAHGGADWPKVIRGKKEFAEILGSIGRETQKSEDELVEELLGMLSISADTPIQKREDLRNTIRVLPFELQNDLLPPDERWYGTRLSTVILVRKDGSVKFVEQDVFELGTEGGNDVVEGNTNGNGQAKEAKRPCLAGSSSRRMFEFNIRRS